MEREANHAHNNSRAGGGKFRRIQDHESHDQLLREIFDADAWLRHFKNACDNQNRDGIRSMRVFIGRQTKFCCDKFSYRLPDGSTVQICDRERVIEQATKTVLIPYGDLYDFRCASRGCECEVKAEERDCLEAALEMKTKGLNPVVLNMASPKHAGGGWRSGAGAQEENLFRRSNYFQSLEDPGKEFAPARPRWYPLDEFELVYSPEVIVFRGAEARGYPFLEQPVPLAFIAAAAYTRPALEPEPNRQKAHEAPFRLSGHFVENTRKKIQIILKTAYDRGHDAVVLSAFGCGAFGNPPQHMAELFRSVLLKDFRGCFRKISFAIFDDHNSRKRHNPIGNFEPFRRVFENFDWNAKVGDGEGEAKEDESEKTESLTFEDLERRGIHVSIPKPRAKKPSAAPKSSAAPALAPSPSVASSSPEMVLEYHSSEEALPQSSLPPEKSLPPGSSLSPETEQHDD